MHDAEAKGDRAKQILENEVFQEAVRAAKDKLKDKWGHTADPETRDALWHQYKAAEAVSIELTIIRDNGIVARKRREKEEDRA